MIGDKLLNILACPVCKTKVVFDGKQSMACYKCDNVYPVYKDVPVMLDKEVKEELKKVLSTQRGEEMRREWSEASKKHMSIKEKVWEVIKPPKHCIDIDKDALIKPLVDTMGSSAVIVEIGVGSKKRISQSIGVDISCWNNTEVVAIGEKLPFLDNSVDFIINEAVLEHVKEPNLIVSEIYRVLRAGGYVYVDVAFNQPYHGFPCHYQNFTLDGLEFLFKDFWKVASGIVAGPASTLCNIITKLIPILVGKRKYITRFFQLIVGWTIIFPLRYLDLILIKRPEAVTMATSLYFIGKKGQQEGSNSYL